MLTPDKRLRGAFPLKTALGLPSENKVTLGYSKSYAERLTHVRGGNWEGERLDRKPGSIDIQHEERHRQSWIGVSCGRVIVLGAQEEEGVESTKPVKSKVNGVPGKTHTFC